MILPTALVERWPLDRYRIEGATVESALKNINKDILKLYQELKLLKEVAEYIPTTDSSLDYNSLSKEEKIMFKRTHGPDSLTSRLSHEIAFKEEELMRLIKYNDYPAMVMAAYPDSVYMDKSRYWNDFDTITGPVLLRGISNAKIGRHAQENGHDYYFIETGYLGNYRCPNNRTGRKIYHRIVKNDMQHNSIMDVPDDRWNQLVQFNPNLEYKGWRRTGSKILVVLSTEKPFQYYEEDRDKWLKKVKSTLKKHTDREIVFRTKASRGERTNDTIYDALDDDIYALVTYNSIAAVEAIQYGIPAFELAPTAADPVGNKDLKMIETPNMPDEEVIKKWLHSIAYSQFSLDEIVTGQAWKMVLENEQRPTIDL